MPAAEGKMKVAENLSCQTKRKQNLYVCKPELIIYLSKRRKEPMLDLEPNGLNNKKSVLFFWFQTEKTRKK